MQHNHMHGPEASYESSFKFIDALRCLRVRNAVVECVVFCVDHLTSRVCGTADPFRVKIPELAEYSLRLKRQRWQAALKEALGAALNGDTRSAQSGHCLKRILY